MCGILGFIGDWPREAKAAMCFVNSLRGTGGFGCCWLHEEKDKFEWRCWKTRESVVEVMRSGDIPEEAFASRVFLAHTRNPSPGKDIGGISDRNSHPFRAGKIIAAHNGYVSNYDDIAKELEIQVPKVDSEIIPEVLSRKGVNGLSELSGVISTWFVEDGSKKVNLWCWNQDLAIWDGDERGIAFTSDYQHFAAIGIRTKGQNSPFPLDRTLGQLLSWEETEDALVYDHKDIKGKFREYPAVRYASGYGRGTTYVGMKAYSQIPQGSKECFICGGDGKQADGSQCQSCLGLGYVDGTDDLPIASSGTSMDKNQKKSYARSRSKLGKMQIKEADIIEIFEAALGEGARHRLCNACGKLVSYAEIDKIEARPPYTDSFIHRNCKVIPKGITILQTSDDVCEYAVDALSKHPMQMLAILGGIRELEFLGYMPKVNSKQIEGYLYDRDVANSEIPGFSEIIKE